MFNTIPRNRLYYACEYGDIKAVEDILDGGEVDINERDFIWEYTPLQKTMKTPNRDDILRRLLAHPLLELDKVDRENDGTALHYAALINNASGVRLFCNDRRCTPRIVNMKDSGGNTALMVAVKKGHLDIVKELDKVEGTDFRPKDNCGDTLIEVARKQVAILEKRKAGKYIEEDDEDGGNENSNEVLEYLLRRKVDSLEEIAAYNVAKHVDGEINVEALDIPLTLKTLVKEYLLERKKRMKLNTKELSFACSQGDIQAVEEILNRKDLEININDSDPFYGTPLKCAMDSRTHNPNIVRKLLALPSLQLDTCDDKGNTALHKACFYFRGSCMISVFCQDRRCTPSILNKKNNDGETALMVAVGRLNLDIVKEFDKVESTDFCTMNKDGKTLIEVARMMKERVAGCTREGVVSESNQMFEYLEQRNKKVPKK